MCRWDSLLLGLALLPAVHGCRQDAQQEDTTERHNSSSGDETPARVNADSVFGFVPDSGSVVVVQHFDPILAFSSDLIEPLLQASSAKERAYLPLLQAARGKLESGALDRKPLLIMPDRGEVLFSAASPDPWIAIAKDAGVQLRCVAFDPLPGYHHCGLNPPVKLRPAVEDLRERASTALPNTEASDVPIVAIVRTAGLQSLVAVDYAADGLRLDIDLEEFFNRSHPFFVPRPARTPAALDTTKAFSWWSMDPDALSYYALLDNPAMYAAFAGMSGEAALGAPKSGHGVAALIALYPGAPDYLSSDQAEGFASMLGAVTPDGAFQVRRRPLKTGRGPLEAVEFMYRSDPMPAWADSLGLDLNLWLVNLTHQTAFIFGGDAAAARSLNTESSAPRPLSLEHAPAGLRAAVAKGDAASLSFTPLSAFSSGPFLDWLEQTGLLTAGSPEHRSPVLLVFDSVWTWFRIGDTSHVLSAHISFFPKADAPYRSQAFDAFGDWVSGATLKTAYRTLATAPGAKTDPALTPRLRLDRAAVAEGALSALNGTMGQFTPLLVAAQINGLRPRRGR